MYLFQPIRTSWLNILSTYDPTDFNNLLLNMYIDTYRSCTRYIATHVMLFFFMNSIFSRPGIVICRC